jgi:hypothetical protein
VRTILPSWETSFGRETLTDNTSIVLTPAV